GANGGVPAVDDVSIEFASGTFTAIMGPSGSGKSTLMHCLSGLDTPTSGLVELAGVDLTALADQELTRLRRDHIGFLFQAFNLLPTLTAEENILLPLTLSGAAVDPGWFTLLVTALGVDQRLGHRPAQLSGGQQQRVAAARSLIHRPAVLFADEPTGALDSNSGATLLGFLRAMVDDHGQTVVMVTHDATAATYADRVQLIVDGRLTDVVEAPTRARVLQALSRVGG
ncbi:ABC transporter ATP-binding protein, partial [Saccharothrix algeriensis]